MAETGQILTTLRRVWWLILLGPLVAGFAGYYYSDSQNRQYESTSEILVRQLGGLGASTRIDVTISRQLAESFAAQFLSSAVIQRASADTDGAISPEEFKKLVTVNVPSSGQIISVTARYPDPETAALIVNSVSRAFIDNSDQSFLVELARLESLASARGITDIDPLIAQLASTNADLQIISDAVPNLEAVAPRPRRVAIAAALLGLLITATMVAVLEYWRDLIPDPDSLEDIFGLPSLGAIQMERGSSTLALTDTKLTNPRAESYGYVIANIKYISQTKAAKIFLVTSPRARDGKSVIVANLAYAAALAGLNVTIVDADMRRPSLHNYIKNTGTIIGLTDFITNPKTNYEDILVKLEPPLSTSGKANAILGGTFNSNHHALLANPRLAELIDTARANSDLVFIDSPAVLAVSDALSLARMCHAIILVANHRSGKRSELRKSLRALRRVDKPIIGIISNQVIFPKTNLDYYYYDYKINASTDNVSKWRSLSQIIRRRNS